MGESASGRASWPLPFQMSPTGHGFWSHKHYRGPQDQQVRVLYSRTKLESEEIAHEFLGEKVIGFDMEWPWETNTTASVPLQQRIGLIQIACEDKIALFHIGLHSGNTAKDLLAPALRNIIEDPAVAKCGVAVHNADFARLQQWFGLKPRGAFELSHLHNLISFGASNPARCTTKLRGLAAQVEQHLGLPLHKGKVRTSNWSQPLNKDQVHYAAADAYAGFMLFHCLNAKRMDMVPAPPLPVYAETYGHTTPGLPRKRLLKLLPQPGSLQPTSVLNFYRPPRDAEAADAGADVIRQPRGQYAAEQQQEQQQQRKGVSPGGISPSMIPATKPAPLKANKSVTVIEHGVLDEARTELLFQELRKHRRDLAKQRKCAPFIIARDTVLHAISRKCPRSRAEMLRVRGVGEKKLADCGPAWLEIVKDLVERPAIEDSTPADEGGQQPSSIVQTTLQPELSASHAQPDQLIRSTPTLHTGISFTMQNVGLDCKEGNEEASDDRSAFGSPLREPSPSVLKRKREDIETRRKPDRGRGGTPQRKYRSGRVYRAAASNIPRGSHDLAATPDSVKSDRWNTSAGHVLIQSPLIDRDDTLTPQEVTRATRASVGRPPSAAPSKMDAPQDPAARPEVNLQPKTRESNNSEVQAKILRNKIVAFNKLVTTSVQLPSSTIEHLVNKLPATIGELLQVPGIMPFANACSRANRDLLGFLAKCAPATG